MPGTFVYTPPPAGADCRRRPDAVGHLHADRRGELQQPATATVAITVIKATPVITWPTPANIIYGTALSATQLNATTTVPGTFVYNPGGRHGALGGRGADAVGHVHADRRGELHHGDGDVQITVIKATPVDHLGDAGGHRLRHGAQRDAAERDHAPCPARSSTRRPRARCCGGRGADAVGDVHADRRRELHLGDGERRRSTSVKATPVITWPTPADIVYGARAERDAAERDDDRARHVRLHAGGRHGAERRAPRRRCR